MPYELVTLNDLTQALFVRLNSSNWWTQAELTNYIIEALRTWQAMSASYTTRASFPTQPNALFYNLLSVAPGMAPTVTDQDMLVQIQQFLQEPTSPTSWPGSAQFSLTSVVNAIQQARDKFFIESGLGMSVVSMNGPAPPAGTVELPDHVIDVRRAMWVAALGVNYPLWRVDQFDMTAAYPAWAMTPGLPQDYSTVLQQPLILQLLPPPSDVGTITLLATQSGGDLNPASGATILGVPDDLSWVVKWGALASLFVQDGPGQDLGRAQYCMNRWMDGIQLARITNFVRFGYIDGNPTFVDSMEELDQSNPLWVQSLPGSPAYLGLSGNIIACSPISNNQPHSIALDIMPNFPIPAGSGYVQIGNETVEAILDYSQHLAYVKESAGALKDSYHLYKSFSMLAATQNDRFRAQAKNFDVLSDRTTREEKFTKRRNSDLGIKELGDE